MLSSITHTRKHDKQVKGIYLMGSKLQESKGNRRNESKPTRGVPDSGGEGLRDNDRTASSEHPSVGDDDAVGGTCVSITCKHDAAWESSSTSTVTCTPTVSWSPAASPSATPPAHDDAVGESTRIRSVERRSCVSGSAVEANTGVPVAAEATRGISELHTFASYLLACNRSRRHDKNIFQAPNTPAKLRWQQDVIVSACLTVHANGTRKCVYDTRTYE
jgi:hypothetical protein